jgi:hypothetical protein
MEGGCETKKQINVSFMGNLSACINIERHFWPSEHSDEEVISTVTFVPT